MIDTEKMYTRASLARALGVNYHMVYGAERRGEIPAPGFPMWRRLYYSQPELMLVLAWHAAKVRCGAV